ncbi:MAG: hypothetical protein D8H97_21510 [Neisseria sp.]|nr:MAG: hypothetical protein D8H97_21510 [Neisseria sp.]
MRHRKNKYITENESPKDGRPSEGRCWLRLGMRSILGVSRCILWECAAAVFYLKNASVILKEADVI